MRSLWIRVLLASLLLVLLPGCLAFTVPDDDDSSDDDDSADDDDAVLDDDDAADDDDASDDDDAVDDDDSADDDDTSDDDDASDDDDSADDDDTGADDDDTLPDDDDASDPDDDGDGSPASQDCDDSDPARYPGNLEICDGVDNDCDSVVPPYEADADNDGVRACDDDCDDMDAARFPGNLEACDGVDNDCDTVVPTDELDGDGDGEAPCAGDCDDADATRFTAASEACNGIDDDCDGAVPPDEQDGDGDGLSACDGDCDDGDAAVAPGAPEVCDGLDNDCDNAVPVGEVTETLPAGPTILSDCAGGCVGGVVYTVTQDVEITGVELYGADLDGSSSEAVAVYRRSTIGDPWELLDSAPMASGPSPLWAGSRSLSAVVPAGDQLLAAAGWVGAHQIMLAPGTVSPSWGTYLHAEGSTDGVGLLPDPWVPTNGELAGFSLGLRIHAGLADTDLDGDGVIGCLDCDDANAAIYPGAPENCDGVDEDCDGAVEPLEWDVDADGSLGCDDCDDGNADIFPGAPELCDGLDTDCDGGLPPDEVDGDGDGISECAGDCDDTDASITPEAVDEACDGIDNDCDGAQPFCAYSCTLQEEFEGTFPNTWVPSSGTGISLTSSAAHDQAQGFAVDPSLPVAFWYRDDVPFGQDGEILRAWFRLEDGRVHLAFGAWAGGALSFYVDDSTGELGFEENTSFGFNVLTTSTAPLPSEQWLQIEVEVVDQASGTVTGRVFGDTQTWSVTHAFGAGIDPGIGWRTSAGAVDSVETCLDALTEEDVLTPETGTFLGGDPVYFANRGYRFTAGEDFSIDGASWQVSQPTGFVRAYVWNQAGVLLATGSVATGTGAHDWLRSDLEFDFSAGQTYTLSFHTNRAAEATFHRMDAPVTPFEVGARLSDVLVRSAAGPTFTNGAPVSWPDTNNTWAPHMKLHVVHE